MVMNNFNLLQNVHKKKPTGITMYTLCLCIIVLLLIDILQFGNIGNYMIQWQKHHVQARTTKQAKIEFMSQPQKLSGTTPRKENEE